MKDKKYSFSDCLELYNFNTFLRENLNRFTGQIELLLRATLIQQICESYENKKNEDKIAISEAHIRETSEMREKELIKKIQKMANKDVGFEKLYKETEKKLEGSFYSVLSNTKNISMKYARELVDMFGNESIENVEKLMGVVLKEALLGMQNIGETGIKTFNKELQEKNYIDSNDFHRLFSEMIKKNQQEITSIIQNEKEDILQEASNRKFSNMFKFESGELYLDKAIYKKINDKEIKEAEEIIESFVETIKESKSDAIEHHRKKGIGIPIWVLLEEVTYGNVYHFVVALEEEFKNAWISSFSELGSLMPKDSENLILGWFRAVNFLRNECAHYNRLYGRYFTVSPPALHKQDIKNTGINPNDNKTLFANMLTVKNLIGTHVLAVGRWNSFIEELEFKINKHTDIIRLDRMGFPENWKENLILKKSDEYLI